MANVDILDSTNIDGVQLKDFADQTAYNTATATTQPASAANKILVVIGNKVHLLDHTGTLFEYATLVGTETLTNKTLTTPTIGDLTNATHTHQNNAGGGTLDAAAIAAGTLLHERGGLEADVSAYDGFIRVAGGATSNIKINLSAIVAPTINEDSGDGYGVGSLWIDTTADDVYMCVDATLGAAVWVQLDAAAGGGAPTDATYLTQTANGTLSAEQALSALSTGLMVVTNGTGVVTSVAAPSGAVVGTTDAQTLTNKTLTTPTIADLTNATHDHSNAASGGTLPAASIGSGTLAHERGGLEADVSAYNGFPHIAGGVTTDIRSNLTATTAPTANEDSGDGYQVGSIWVNVTLDDVYMCVDNTLTAAVWVQLDAAGGGGGTVTPGVVEGRLSLSSTDPAPVADQTAATTLYYLPYIGNQIALYDGADWGYHTIADAGVSIAIPATTDTNYDVYLYDATGTLTLELVAWTNDTTRATALVRQNGVYVKTGALTRRYLGVIRTTAVSGQCESSVAGARFVRNYYNRIKMAMRVLETTNSWSYTSTTYRPLNNSTSNRIQFLVDVDDDTISAVGTVNARTSAGADFAVGIGLDSTTTRSSLSIGGKGGINGTAAEFPAIATFEGNPGVGYHYLQLLESGASGITLVGDNGGVLTVSGIVGSIWG